MVLRVNPPIPTGDFPTPNDSESNPMLKSHAYLAQTAGFVNAFFTLADVNMATAHIGTTSDPFGEGIMISQHRCLEAGMFDLSFFVAKGLYFEIRHPATAPTILWTPLIAGGGAPIDQD